MLEVSRVIGTSRAARVTAGSVRAEPRGPGGPYAETKLLPYGRLQVVAGEGLKI